MTFDSWIDSGKLPSIPDPITGLNTEELRVYLVPSSWTRETTGSMDRQQMEGESVATQQDLANFESVRAADGGGSGSSGGSSSGGANGGGIGASTTGTIVKTEGGKVMQQLKDKVEQFTAEKNQHLMTLLTTVTELHILSTTAQGSKFTAPVADTVATLVTKVTKVKKSMGKWLMEPSSLKDKGLEVLMQQVFTVLAQKADLAEMAAKMGIAGTTGKRANKLKGMGFEFGKGFIKEFGNDWCEGIGKGFIEEFGKDWSGGLWKGFVKEFGKD